MSEFAYLHELGSTVKSSAQRLRVKRPLAGRAQDVVVRGWEVGSGQEGGEGVG